MNTDKKFSERKQRRSGTECRQRQSRFHSLHSYKFSCLHICSLSSMTRFRPCIDLHAGQVKQIVGGTLGTDTSQSLRTNHVSPHSAGHFARLYREKSLTGAHVIMLGPGNEDAAHEALAAWPGSLQVGGGIHAGNAAEWIGAGAEKVRSVVTLYTRSGLRSGR